MNKPLPNETQCREAAADYPWTQVKDRKGRNRWRVYTVFIRKGTVRSTMTTSDDVRVGALHIAADGNRREVNAALARAAELLWPYDGDSVFSGLVIDLALSMLRYNWRRGAEEQVRFFAEMDAQCDPDDVVEADMPDSFLSDDTCPTPS